MTLTDVAAVAGVGSPILLAVIGYLNKGWIFKVFVPKVALALDNSRLAKENQWLRTTIEALTAQANGWKGAADAAAFSREDANVLIARIEKLEVYVPKFKSAISHIQNLNRMIIGLLSTLKAHNIKPESEMPVVPDEIRLEVEDETGSSL